TQNQLCVARLVLREQIVRKANPILQVADLDRSTRRRSEHALSTRWRFPGLSALQPTKFLKLLSGISRAKLRRVGLREGVARAREFRIGSDSLLQVIEGRRLLTSAGLRHPEPVQCLG